MKGEGIGAGPPLFTQVYANDRSTLQQKNLQKSSHHKENCPRPKGLKLRVFQRTGLVPIKNTMNFLLENLADVKIKQADKQRIKQRRN